MERGTFSGLKMALLIVFWGVFLLCAADVREISLKWSCRLSANKDNPHEQEVKKFKMTINIDENYYQEEIRQGLREDTGTFAGLLMAYLRTDQWLRSEMAYKISILTEGMEILDKISVALNLVSCIPYQESDRIYKLPIQTLWDMQGDCFDKTLLAMWLLNELNRYGISVKTGLVVTQGASDPSLAHVGIAIHIPGVQLNGTIVTINEQQYALTDVTKQGMCILGNWKRDVYKEVMIIIPPRIQPYFFNLEK